VDIGGRESANAAMVVSTIAGLTGFNVVVDLAEDAGFAGNKDHVGVIDGALHLSGADSIDDWVNIDLVSNADIGDGGLASEGVYGFSQAVDTGAVYTSRLTADMNAAGTDNSVLVDTWGDVDGQESWDQTVDPSLWNILLELRKTDDNPSASPVWSGWMPFIVGDYSARGFQFRATMKSGAPTVTPVVSRLRVSVDMPDRTAAERNITAAAAGSALSFARAFHATPALSVTAQDMATGDYYAITSLSASGFTIRFFNAGGTGISRTFDYLAKGYGEQI
jgi:hypothetical protein